MPHQLHLAEGIIHAHRGGHVFLGTDDLPWAELILVRIHVVLALLFGISVALVRGWFCTVVHQRSGGLSHGDGGAVAGSCDLASSLHLAQRAFQTAERYLQRCVEGIFLGFRAGNVAGAGGRDLDPVGLIGAARIGLMLELHVEEIQGGVKPLDLGELGVHTFREVFGHLHVAASDLHFGFWHPRSFALIFTLICTR